MSSSKEPTVTQKQEQLIQYPLQEAFHWETLSKFLGNAETLTQLLTTVNPHMIPSLLNENVRILFMNYVENVYVQYMTQMFGLIAPIELRDKPAEEIALIFKTKGYIAESTSHRGVKRKNNPISMEKFQTGHQIVGYEIQIPQDKLDGGFGQALVQEELRAAAASVVAASEYILARFLATGITCSVIAQLFEKREFTKDRFISLWEREMSILHVATKRNGLYDLESIHLNDQMKTLTETPWLLIGRRTQNALRKAKENTEYNIYGNNVDGAQNKLSGLQPIERVASTLVKVLINCGTPDFYDDKSGDRQHFDMSETVSIRARGCLVSPTPNIDYTKYSSKEDYVLLQNFKTRAYEGVTQEWAFDHATMFADDGTLLALPKEMITGHFMYDQTAGTPHKYMYGFLKTDDKSCLMRIVAIGNALYGAFLRYSGFQEHEVIKALKIIAKNTNADPFDGKSDNDANKVITVVYEFMTGYFDIESVTAATSLILYFAHGGYTDNIATPKLLATASANTTTILVDTADQAKRTVALLSCWNNHALAPYLAAMFLHAHLTKKNFKACHRLGIPDPIDYFFGRTTLLENTESGMSLKPGETVYRTLAMPINELYATKETGMLHVGYEVHMGVHPLKKENFHAYPHIQPYKYISGGEVDFKPHKLNIKFMTEERVTHFVVPIPPNWKRSEPFMDFSGLKELAFASLPGFATYVRMYRLGPETGPAAVVYGLSARLLRTDFELETLKTPETYLGEWEAHRRLCMGTLSMHRGTGPHPDPEDDFTYYTC